MRGRRGPALETRVCPPGYAQDDASARVIKVDIGSRLNRTFAAERSRRVADASPTARRAPCAGHASDGRFCRWPRLDCW